MKPILLKLWKGVRMRPWMRGKSIKGKTKGSMKVVRVWRVAAIVMMMRITSHYPSCQI